MRLAMVPALALSLYTAAAAAQEHRIVVGAGPEIGWATGTLGTYLGPAVGAGASVRWHLSPLSLRLDADYAQFLSTRVARPYPGTTADVDIETTMRAFTVLGGPEVGMRMGRISARVTASAGVARSATTSTLSGLGDPTYYSRSTTFDDLTWALAAGGGTGVLISGGHTPVWVVVDGSYRRTGDVRIVREDALRSGVISGLYLPPTPTPASWVVVRLFVAIGTGQVIGGAHDQ